MLRVQRLALGMMFGAKLPNFKRKINEKKKLEIKTQKTILKKEESDKKEELVVTENKLIEKIYNL